MSKITVSKDGPYLVSDNLPLAKVMPTNSSIRRATRSAAAAAARTNLIVTAVTPSSALTGSKRRVASPIESSATPRASAFAGFCDSNGQVWSLVGDTDQAEAKRDFVRETCDCPSGRLVACDNKTGEPIEPHYEASIGLIEDPVEIAPARSGCVAGCRSSAPTAPTTKCVIG